MSEADNTYPEGITPERLMAYADGVLEADEAARVEAALAAHPALVEEVEAYRQTAAALADALDGPLGEPVPAHLEALVMGGNSDGETVTSLQDARMRRRAGLPVWGQAIAACAVFAFGAVIGGQWLGGNVAEPAQGRLLVAGPLDAGHPVARALETAASAQTVELPGGRFDAVASFPTASGDPCREFEASDARGSALGLACRRDHAWTVELLLNGEAGAAPGAGFRLASGGGGELIDSALTSLEAGIGLSADAEACLIANDWDAGRCLSQAGE